MKEMSIGLTHLFFDRMSVAIQYKFRAEKDAVTAGGGVTA